MDFQTILDGIDAEGRLKVRQIEEEAGRMIADINQTAEKSTGIQQNRILSDGRARLNRECALIEQQAVVQALQIHADARQSLIESTLQNIQKAFPSIRDREDYPEFLSKMVDEVIRSLQPSLLEGQRMILHADDRDRKALEKILVNFDLPVDVKFDINSCGGCNGGTEDGQVIALNTIEARFVHADKLLQQRLSIMFEEKNLSV